MEVYVIMGTSNQPSSFGEISKPCLLAVVSADKLQEALKSLDDGFYTLSYESTFLNTGF